MQHVKSDESNSLILCWKTASIKREQIPGSTASRAKGDALPLFPTEPTTQTPNHNVQRSEQKTRVIKDIPGSRRVGTRGAARICDSIQEERKQEEREGESRGEKGFCFFFVLLKRPES